MDYTTEIMTILHMAHGNILIMTLLTYGDDKMRVTDRQPLEDPILNDLFQFIMDKTEPKSIGYWIGQIALRANEIKDQIIERYIAAALLSISQTENKQLCQNFIDRFSQNSDTSAQNTNSPLD